MCPVASSARPAARAFVALPASTAVRRAAEDSIMPIALAVRSLEIPSP